MMRKRGTMPTLGVIVRRTAAAMLLGAAAGISSGCQSQAYAHLKLVDPRVSYDMSKKNVTQKDIDTMFDCTDQIGVTLTYKMPLPKQKPEDKQEYSTIKKETGGSLIHIANEDGYAYYLTSNHIVKAPEEVNTVWGHKYTLAGNEIYVEMTGKEDKKIPLDVLASDEKADIALVRTKSKHKPTTRPYNYFALDSSVRIGNQVYSVGFPFILGKQLSEGIVRAKTTSKLYEKEGVFYQIYWISSNLNPGNSGGPTFVLQNGRPRILGIGKFSINAGNGLHGVVNVESIRKFMLKHKYERFYKEKDFPD